MLRVLMMDDMLDEAMIRVMKILSKQETLWWNCIYVYRESQRLVC